MLYLGNVVINPFEEVSGKSYNEILQDCGIVRDGCPESLVVDLVEDFNDK